jgi:hypothetical protein
VPSIICLEDLPFEEIVSIAKKEIRFASVTHELVADYQWDVIRGAIIRGVKITVMVKSKFSTCDKTRTRFWRNVS